MYVCLCSGVTNTEINEAIDSGVVCMDGMKEALSVATQCGSCDCEVRAILNARLTPAATTATSITPTTKMGRIEL